MQHEISHPHDQDREVDGKDPEHENKNRVRIVVEAVIGIHALFAVSTCDERTRD